MKYFIWTVLSLMSVMVYGQNWVEVRDQGGSLDEIKQAFEEEWGDQEYEKGKGWKQYHRWMNFWEPRLMPSGDFSAVNATYQNYLRKDNRDESVSNRDMGNWESLGLTSWIPDAHAPGNGRVNVIHIGDDYVLIGSPSGGLWKYTDEDSWQPMSDQIPSLGVSGIVVHPENDDIIYIATGDDDNNDTYSVGVLKSTDGGETWETTGLSFAISDQVRIRRLEVHPDNPDVIFAGTTGGLYRTENAGLTWDIVFGGQIRDIEFKPDSSNVVYMCKEKLYRSDNSGLTFSEYGEGLPIISQVTRMEIEPTEADPNIWYALYSAQNYTYYGLYRSDDAGQNWTLQSDSPNIFSYSSNGFGADGAAWYNMELAVSPVDPDHVFVGGINLWESTNAGQNWVLNGYWNYNSDVSPNYLHADIHHLEFVDGVLHIGSDGGYQVSEDYGETIDDLSEGLSISQLYHVGVSLSSSEFMLIGLQDCGVNMLEDGAWFHVEGGDGFEGVIHPEDESIMYCLTQYGGIRKSVNGGSSFDASTNGITENGAWDTPFMMSPINPSTLYAGFENVWRSTNSGSTWTSISEFNDQLHSLAMSSIDPNTIYAASPSDIYKTNNGGGEWVEISNGLPGQAISDISVDPMNADRLWISLSGFNETHKVYYSENGGEDWTNLSAGLPNVPINTIIYDPSTDDDIYVGTDNGIYFMNGSLASWESFNVNLPNVVVTELEIHEADQKIIASTYGRGVWISDLWTGPESVPVADFSHFPHAICVGGEVEFFDMSQYNEPTWSWEFPGADVAISDQMNPLVTYSSPGTYDVVLTVQNELGEQSVSCEGCVHVFESDPGDVPFVEGFEDAAELNELGWFIDEEIEGIHWELNESVGASGDQCLWIENRELDVESIYEIYSEPLDLSAEVDTGNYYMTFKYAYGQIDGEEVDRLRIYVSENCGDSWSLKEDLVGDDDLIAQETTEGSFVPTESQWVTHVVEIDDEAMSEDVMFKFWFRNANGNNLYIDDINIFSGYVSVEEFEKKTKLSVYPNPATDVLNISIDGYDGANWTLNVYDPSGRCVLSEQYSTNMATINTNSLASGMYQYVLTLGRQGQRLNGQFIIE